MGKTWWSTSRLIQAPGGMKFRGLRRNFTGPTEIKMTARRRGRAKSWPRPDDAISSLSAFLRRERSAGEWRRPAWLKRVDPPLLLNQTTLLESTSKTCLYFYTARDYRIDRTTPAIYTCEYRSCNPFTPVGNIQRRSKVNPK